MTNRPELEPGPLKRRRVHDGKEIESAFRNSRVFCLDSSLRIPSRIAMHPRIIAKFSF